MCADKADLDNYRKVKLEVVRLGSSVRFAVMKIMAELLRSRSVPTLDELRCDFPITTTIVI